MYAYALQKMKQNNRRKYLASMPTAAGVDSEISQGESGVVGFVFPLMTEADIERLEAEVNSRRVIRLQYVNFLIQLKQPSEAVDDVFRKIFYDEALSNYNYNGMCNVPHLKKRPMKDYAIFMSCFLEAWSDQGVTQEHVANALRKVIKLLNNRKRFRRHKQKKRAASSGGAFGGDDGVELILLENTQ